MRVEENIGSLSALYASSKGSKVKIYDFAPHLDEPEMELHEFMQQLQE